MKAVFVSQFYQKKIIMETIYDIERHPLEPFLPSNALILMLGSFPPQKKKMEYGVFLPQYPK